MLYPKVKPEDFADLYTKHVAAMTEEKLEKKSDIAMQLAWRDVRILELQERVDDLETDVARLMDGF